MDITVTFYNEEYQCAKAIKGPDYIKLYDEHGNVIATFYGISDFSDYTIDGGDWSDPEPTEIELLRAQLELAEEALDTLIMGGV